MLSANMNRELVMDTRRQGKVVEQMQKEQRRADRQRRRETLLAAAAQGRSVALNGAGDGSKESAAAENELAGLSHSLSPHRRGSLQGAIRNENQFAPDRDMTMRQQRQTEKHEENRRKFQSQAMGLGADLSGPGSPETSKPRMGASPGNDIPAGLLNAPPLTHMQRKRIKLMRTPFWVQLRAWKNSLPDPLLGRTRRCLLTGTIKTEFGQEQGINPHNPGVEGTGGGGAGQSGGGQANKDLLLLEHSEAMDASRKAMEAMRDFGDNAELKQTLATQVLRKQAQLKRNKKLEDFHLIDLFSGRTAIGGLSSELEEEIYLVKGRPLLYRTWLYHRLWSTYSGDTTRSACIYQALGMKCHDDHSPAWRSAFDEAFADGMERPSDLTDVGAMDTASPMAALAAMERQSSKDAMAATKGERRLSKAFGSPTSGARYGKTSRKHYTNPSRSLIGSLIGAPSIWQLSPSAFYLTMVFFALLVTARYGLDVFFVVDIVLIIQLVVTYGFGDDYSLYKYDRIGTFPLRLALFIYLLATLQPGSDFGAGGLGVLAGIGGIVCILITLVDLLADLNMLITHSGQKSFDVIQELPGNVFVCRQAKDGLSSYPR